MDAYVQIVSLAKKAGIIDRNYLTERELIIILDTLTYSLIGAQSENEVILCHA